MSHRDIAARSFRKNLNAHAAPPPLSRLVLLKLGCAAFDEVRHLGQHFLVRPAAGRLEAAVQAFRQIDAQPTRRLRLLQLSAGSLFSTFGEMWVCVSCPAPPRSNAAITSAVSGFGFGACANVLLIENIQQFMS